MKSNQPKSKIDKSMDTFLSPQSLKELPTPQYTIDISNYQYNLYHKSYRRAEKSPEVLMMMQAA